MAIGISVWSDSSAVRISSAADGSGIAVCAVCDDDGLDLAVVPADPVMQIAEDPQDGEVVVSTDSVPIYGGVYEVVPGETAQTLSTAGKTMVRDVVVSAIPSNYGRIGWNGFQLTVT